MSFRDTCAFVTISVFVLILANACKKDDEFVPMCDGSTPTYDAEIATIINDNCTNLACHSAGSANGDWTSYINLKPVLDNGEFEKQVLTDMTMPQGDATLTESQLNLIRCWADNNYPEN